MTVTLTIVPYPTHFSSITIAGPPLVEESISNYLPGAYGTDFLQKLAPSTRASGNDLHEFSELDLLDIKEHVTSVSGRTLADSGKANQPDGSYESEFRIEIAGYMNDQNSMPVGDFDSVTITDEGTIIEYAQDYLWRSKAPDSLNAEWHEFVTNLPIKWIATRVGNGQTITTSHGNVEFVQPRAFDTSYAALLPLAGYPLDIPAGGSTIVVLEGTVRLTASDIKAGTKTFTVKLYDQDVGASTLDLLESVDVVVPARRGVPFMHTPFIATASLNNSAGTVGGSLGNSGTATAQVFYYVDGTKSNFLEIRAR
jgi:hypothetical protein